jgi:hypothetical protein
VGRKQIHPTTKSCEKKFVFPDAYNPELPKSKSKVQSSSVQKRVDKEQPLSFKNIRSNLQSRGLSEIGRIKVNTSVSQAEPRVTTQHEVREEDEASL